MTLRQLMFDKGFCSSPEGGNCTDIGSPDYHRSAYCNPNNIYSFRESRVKHLSEIESFFGVCIEKDPITNSPSPKTTALPPEPLFILTQEEFYGV